ncbi:MAG: ADP-ribosylation factor-directed GTPase activating protein isoform b [Planctomycetia bacterium]|nr:ADP-ribosylation factor-directed GTPase activating protein isoform b [Planctomycetia bacterium]
MGFFYAVARPPVRSRFDRRFSWSLATAGLLIGLLAGCGQPTTGGTAGGKADTGDAVASPIDRRKLCKRIDAVLAHARDDRRLDASVHGAWQVVHGILAFGRDFPLRHDGTDSAALDYLLDGGRLTGWNLRTGSPGVIALLEEGSNTGQGHPDQWLGYLSQCGRHGIPRDTKLVVGKKTSFTVNDLLTQAQADIRPGQEATWTLMALSAYLPIDATWTASDGTKWNTERVVQMEADADIVTSACGGAHRLYGLVAALKKHRAATGHTPEQLSGGWAAAQEVIDECIDRARRFQQVDGSFSIHSFERPGTSADVFAKLSATGHIFEVLSLSLDDEQLSEPWVTRAADRLVTMLEQTADVDVECGCLYHAAHGLLLYSDRVCGSTE